MLTYSKTLVHDQSLAVSLRLNRISISYAQNYKVEIKYYQYKFDMHELVIVLPWDRPEVLAVLPACITNPLSQFDVSSLSSSLLQSVVCPRVLVIQFLLEAFGFTFNDSINFTIQKNFTAVFVKFCEILKTLIFTLKCLPKCLKKLSDDRADILHSNVTIPVSGWRTEIFFQNVQ